MVCSPAVSVVSGGGGGGAAAAAVAVVDVLFADYALQLHRKLRASAHISIQLSDIHTVLFYTLLTSLLHPAPPHTHTRTLRIFRTKFIPKAN